MQGVFCSSVLATRGATAAGQHKRWCACRYIFWRDVDPMYRCVKLLQRRDGDFNPPGEEGHSNPTFSKVSKQSLQDLTGTDVTVCEHTLSAVHFLTRRVYITRLGHSGISVHVASAATSLSWEHACRPYFPDQQTAGVRVFMLLATFQDNFEIIHTPVVCWWLIKKNSKKKSLHLHWAQCQNCPCKWIKFCVKNMRMCVRGENESCDTHTQMFSAFGWRTSCGLYCRLCCLWLSHVGCCNVIFASLGHMYTKTRAFYTYGTVREAQSQTSLSKFQYHKSFYSVFSRHSNYVSIWWMYTTHMNDMKLTVFTQQMT